MREQENLNKKHFSLQVTFSLFILIMASLVIFTVINKSNDDSIESKLIKLGYGNIETINPLVLEESQTVIDKKSINVQLVDEIKRVYNLDILYGEGTENLLQTVDAVAIYDEEQINQILLELIDCLNKYPNNIFKEILLKDYNVELCLANYFNNDNLALATRDSNNNFKVYISNSGESYKITKSIHHELYHILEYYIKLEYDINKLYKDWNSYNPENFEYQENLSKLTTEYVLNLDKNGQAYFVSIYSKSSEKEDRAEVFADTMIADKEPTYYNDDLGAIKGKMKLIVEVLEQSFYSVNYGTSIYWDRYFN